jgi:Tfp pilus assembly protein FimT
MMRNDLLMIEAGIPNRNSKARGLTLVELIIVLLLLIILGLIAIPTFQRIAVNGNLRTAARDLIADLNALREKAMAESGTLDLSFDPAQNLYTCKYSSGPLNGQTYWVKTPASIAKDIRLTGTSYGVVTFFSRGTLSQAGNVVLGNGRGSAATITCNLSGRTYVQFHWQ